jgi:hypothetical protein
MLGSDWAVGMFWKSHFLLTLIESNHPSKTTDELRKIYRSVGKIIDSVPFEVK